MRALQRALAAAMLGAVLFASPAWAADGDSATSDAVGGDATCTMHSAGSGFRVDCTLRDTKRDGNYVRIEWSGPGKSGKDNLRDGDGTQAHFTYTFAADSGSFRFKAVVDRGVLPDSVGATRELIA